jgi:pyruvate/2-oxoglutarate dehydrogenase complex dihydrolipoamide dehydrogenase (E3) component
MKRYDLVVIGGGAGGLTVAAGAASLGAKVALIEKENDPGGDCLHYGCVPSKALIEAGKEVQIAKIAAAEFGMSISGEPSLRIAKKRIKAAIAEIQGHDGADRFRKMGVDVYQGFGFFKDAHHVEFLLKNEVIYGKRIVIATGSRPIVPNIEGIDKVEVLTNETIFEMEETPKRLLVIGAGPIGLELAQAMARFGSDVIVVDQAKEIFSREDETIVPFVKRALEKELKFRLGFKVKKVSLTDTHSKVVTISNDVYEENIEVDEILVAAGRKANIERLGLEEIGIEIEKDKIVVSKTLQTSIPHIYAVGDVNGDFTFTHAAGMEGKVVVANAVFGLRKKVNYENFPWVTYTDPEVFHLGLTEQQARRTFDDNVIVYEVKTDDVDRFVADRKLDGIAKVITDKKGKILGAHAVGPGAGDWMQEIVYAKQHRHNIGNLSNVIHPYPIRSAILQRLADQYWRNKLFGGIVPKITKKYIQWFR